MKYCSNFQAIQMYIFLTISKKKSTCGLLCTKNRTGCRSMTTLSTKSGGVPGRTVCRMTPSWWECIKVSSKSNTSTFRFTIPTRNIDKISAQSVHIGYNTIFKLSNYENKHKSLIIILTESMSGEGRQRKQIIFNRLMLY